MHKHKLTSDLASKVDFFLLYAKKAKEYELVNALKVVREEQTLDRKSQMIISPTNGKALSFL